MKVKIFSDVRCPFCYIGQHKFEAALRQFAHADQVEVVWKSFELDPGLQTVPELKTLDHLARGKGISRQEAEQMTQYVVQAAAEVDLTFNFDQAVVANSFQAHRLIQLGKDKGVASAVEEQLFQAQFIKGQNIDDRAVLIEVGGAAGLEEQTVEQMLSSDAYATAVRQDEAEAQSLGVRGVPFFVFNDKYAVSGAQPVATFLGALEQSWREFRKENDLIVLEDGSSCSVDGPCD